MLPVVFSHANSFPAGTYALLFAQLKQRGIRVQALERFGHDPRFPVTNNWPHLVEQLAEFIRSQTPADASTVPYLVGHSLGGFLSIMVAAKYPELARGVLMLDSPLVAGWRAATLDMAKRTQLVGTVSPGKVSQRRRSQWPSLQEAQSYFASKKLFARWHPQVLADYLSHGLETVSSNSPSDAHSTAPGALQLRFAREVETNIYNTLPHNLSSWLSQHRLKCPVAFIGGRQSVEVKHVGMELTRRITQGRINTLDGTHLFPMEQPEACAAAIEAALLNLEYVRRHAEPADPAPAA